MRFISVDDPLKYYIEHGFITQIEFDSKRALIQSNLRSKEVQQLVSNQIVSFEKIQQLTERQLGYLQQTPAFLSLLLSRSIESRWLLDEALFRYMDEGILTSEALVKLSKEQKLLLINDTVYNLVKENILKWTQAIFLKPEELRALSDSDTVGRVVAGHLPIEQVVSEDTLNRYELSQAQEQRSQHRDGDYCCPECMIRHAFFDALRETMDDLMPAVVVEVTTVVVRGIEAAARRDINHNQSTHTASVHKSVSLALNKLKHRYTSSLNGTEKEAIARLESLIQNDDRNKEKHAVAIRCLQRLARNDEYTDSVSGVTIKRLLALVDRMLLDDAMLLCDQSTAVSHLIEALYEIQRGYNLSEEGVDDCKSQDLPICPAGAMNKLIERFSGVHSYCEIRFVTPQTASRKLQSLVREVVVDHFIDLLKSGTGATELSLNRFFGFMLSCFQSDVSLLWSQIVSKVNHFMQLEFSDHLELSEEFINTGKYVCLDDNVDWSKILPHWELSELRRHYCSVLLRTNLDLWNSLYSSEADSSVVMVPAARESLDFAQGKRLLFLYAMLFMLLGHEPVLSNKVSKDSLLDADPVRLMKNVDSESVDDSRCECCSM